MFIVFYLVSLQIRIQHEFRPDNWKTSSNNDSCITIKIVGRRNHEIISALRVGDKEIAYKIHSCLRNILRR